jgi:hypothetical protein
MDNISWQALEYEYKDKKSRDWFWALGVIVFATAATSIIYANYFFAILIILSGVLLGFFANKEPEVIQYELNEKGLKAGSKFYPFETVLAFFVRSESNPHLFLKIDRAAMPRVSMPIEAESAEIIKSKFVEKGIPEEEMEEHHAEKILEFFGF